MTPGKKLRVNRAHLKRSEPKITNYERLKINL